MNRRAHWQAVYERCRPEELSWFQAQPALSLALIGESGLPTGAAIIDAGGGASRLVDALVERGYGDVSVLDISSRSLRHARQRLGAAADSVSWLVADVTDFVPSRRYALWHDRAVFHFLTQRDDRRRYVAALRKALVPGGRAIIATFASDGPTRCSGLDVVRYDARSLLAELGPPFRLLASRDERHVTPAGAGQKFSYFVVELAGAEG